MSQLLLLWRSSRGLRPAPVSARSRVWYIFCNLPTLQALCQILSIFGLKNESGLSSS
jgi:hypothetical protein